MIENSHEARDPRRINIMRAKVLGAFFLSTLISTNMLLSQNPESRRASEGSVFGAGENRYVVGQGGKEPETCCWLFGADFGADDGSSNLLAIDVEGLQGVDLGELGLNEISDLAFLPDGRLFAVRFVPDGSELVEIDASIPSAEVVGAIGYTGVNSLVAETANTFLAGTHSGLVLRIDAASGSGETIGILGGLATSGDLTFDAAGNLFATAWADNGEPEILVSMDPRDGRATVIGPVGFSNVFGLEFGPTGKLFGIADGGVGETPLLIEIDPRSGAGALIGPLSTSNGMVGLSKYPILFRDGFEGGNLLRWASSEP